MWYIWILNLININISMKIAYKKIKEGVTKFDLFSNSQLLRYG
jgi:hypothetical protein